MVQVFTPDRMNCTFVLIDQQTRNFPKDIHQISNHFDLFFGRVDEQSRIICIETSPQPSKAIVYW
jgi:hypothetical protein